VCKHLAPLKLASLGVANKAELCAVLLTGGASKRMGCDKALLDLQGQPLWAALVGQIAPICAELWVLQSPTQHLSLPTGSPKGTDIKFFEDPQPHQGPLYGLSQITPQLTRPWTLVVSTDLPLLTTEFLSDLVRLKEPNKPVFSCHQGRINPLLALYPTDWLKQAPALWQSGRQDAMALSEQGPYNQINDRPESRGVNRLGDYQAAIRELGTSQ